MDRLSKIFSVFLAVLFQSPLSVYAQTEVKTWDVFTLDMISRKPLNNPYADGLPEGKTGLVRVTFSGQSEDAQGMSLTVTGFWDRGDNWKVRFAPPAAGLWTYRSESEDPGLNGLTGELYCTKWSQEQRMENPTRHGFVKVCQKGDRAGRYFEYADGTPFLWIGDTWWNWTRRGIKLESFQKLADDRAAKGFSVGQLFFAGRGWGQEASLLDTNSDNPDIEHIRHIEQYIQYANSKGITVWIHGWWTSQNMDHTIGAEKMRRWWRYIVHRLGAYNVIWVLAGEYNMYNYGSLGLQFWKDLGTLIDEEDPYERIIGTHPTPPGWDGGADAPQWSTSDVLHNESWMDYNQSQVGHGKWRNEMIPYVVTVAYTQRPAKPIVVTEPWYEFINDSASAADIRFGAWSAILSGAAGHSYAGGQIWKAHVPEAPLGKDIWPMELGFDTNTLDYPGAVSLAFMARFLRGIDWWRLSPQPELILENPSPFCGAVPGREYVIYLRYGGAVKVNLKDTKPQDVFRCIWYDLTESTSKKNETISGGGTPTLLPPEDYPGVLGSKDWLVHLVRQ